MHTITPTSKPHDGRSSQRSGRTAYLRNVVVFLINVYFVLLLIFFALRVLVSPDEWWIAFFINFTPFYFVGAGILFMVALLLRARWTALRLLPFVVIGLVLYAPLYVPRAVAEPEDAIGDTNSISLNVVTFNILFDGRPHDDFIAWFEEQKQTADIIIIQEAQDDFPLMDEGIKFWGEQIWWGTWLYSKHPVVETEHYTLKSRDHMRVVINVDGQEIAVYGIHTSRPSGKPRLNLPAPFSWALNVWSTYNETPRNEQIDEFLKRIQDEPLPYIVAGDFNMSDHSATYSKIAAVMNDAYREAGIGLGTSWPVRRLGPMEIQLLPPLVRIDYIWHSDHFRATSAHVGEFVGSDHLPVHATLVLANPG